MRLHKSTVSSLMSVIVSATVYSSIFNISVFLSPSLVTSVSDVYKFVHQMFALSFQHSLLNIMCVLVKFPRLPILT